MPMSWHHASSNEHRRRHNPSSSSTPSSSITNSNLHINLTITPKQEEPGSPRPPPQQQQQQHQLMPLPPYTTPVPQPVFMPGMSHRDEGPAPAQPTPSPLPIHGGEPKPPQQQDPTTVTSTATAPVPAPFPNPKLRLQINDLGHAGADIFLTSVTASRVLSEGVQTVLRTLYGTPTTLRSAGLAPPPPTRSVTLILRDIDGVAYTTGTELDGDHKEIHLSLRYVAGIAPPTSARRTHEINGVLVHELVHCLQHHGSGTCPGGLVEGVADFVRLRARLDPPHWTPPSRAKPPPPDQRWDAGYQHTAYFLDYLDRRFGDGSGALVQRLNAQLGRGRYVEDSFWPALLGRRVADLWQDYRDDVASGGGGDGGGDGELEAAWRRAVDEGTQT